MQKYNLNGVFRFEGIAFGLFISSVIYSGIELLRYYQIDESWYESPIFLIVPIFLGAWVTVRGLAHQVEVAQKVEDERYLREERAALAILPVPTSQLMRISGKVIDWHLNADHELPDMREFEILLEKLRDTIRFSDPHTGERLLGIIRTYQILEARLFEWQEFQDRDRILKNPEDDGFYNYWENLCNWAVFRARVEQIFDYARGKESKLSQNRVNDRVWSQFFNREFDVGAYPVLSGIMERRAERNMFEMDFSK